MSKDSKRFIKQVVPLKAWRKLGSSLRQAWNYIWMNCDEAGVYVIDEDLYAFDNQCKFPFEELKKHLSEWLLFFEDKILIKAFIETNYGNKLKPDYNPHKPLFRAIKKNRLKLDSSLNQACFKLVDEEEEEEVDEDVEVDEEVEVEEKEELNKKIEFQKIVDIFNSVCKKSPKVQKLTTQRRKVIQARAKEYGLSEIGNVFQSVSQSEFLNGNNQRNWIADFDWIMNPNNFIKILEGKYKSNAKPNSKNNQGASDGFRAKTAQRLGIVQPK